MTASATYTPITGANAVPLDAMGRGTFNWNIPAGQAAGAYLLKVTSNDVPSVSDVSDGSFQIANAGHSYYVNDAYTAGDQYTTAAGNDANDGKSPSTPMATLSALIAAYHPGLGDTIFVDTGAYLLGGNLLLTAADNGLTIQGPTNAAANGSAAYTTQVLFDGPLAYYRLGDAGATAVDSSGNGLNGTFQGGVTKGVAGVLPGDPNTAVTFDGLTGSVKLASGFANFTNGFTWEGWVNPSSLASNGSYQPWFNLGNGASSDNVWFGRYYNNNLALQIYHGGSNTGFMVINNAIELNKWQHFAVTIDGAGNATVYKNGIIIASANVTPITNINRTSNYLGKDDFGNTPFAGQMDEVAFYNKSLNGSQLRQHYDLAAGQGALIDRNNSGVGNYAIELQGANNVTLDHLNVTGGYDGVHTTSTGSANASTHLTLSNGNVFANANAGLNVDLYSGYTLVTSEQAFGIQGDGVTANDQAYGIYLAGGINSSVLNSTAHDSSQAGITNLGDNSSVTASTVFNDGTGINVSGATRQHRATRRTPTAPASTARESPPAR